MSTALKLDQDRPEKSPEPALRGDPITRERYTSPEFAQREWDRLWKRVWNIGGLAYQVPEPGDFVTHELGKESILMMRQEDGRIKAFYNVCQHRGARLTFATEGFANITCPYHSWAFGADGYLAGLPDPEDFPGGNPCGKIKLQEIACDTWGGFIWFNMDPNCMPLREFISPLPEHLEGYGMEKMVRVLNMTADVDCNWKVICDNFNEGYHISTLHPDIAPYIECDYRETQYDLYDVGHNRGWFPGMKPASFLKLQKPQEPLVSMMKEWELNPDDYAGADGVLRIRRDVQKKKRELGPKRGHAHYNDLTDYQLTDYMIYNMIPSASVTMLPDGVQILRSRPHPTDPQKCLFDHWYLVPRLPGVDKVPSPAGGPDLPLDDAPLEHVKYGEKTLGTVADQDLSIAQMQQVGLNSDGYVGVNLMHQERRVQRFHEILNDYMEGRR